MWFRLHRRCIIRECMLRAHMPSYVSRRCVVWSVFYMVQSSLIFQCAFEWAVRLQRSVSSSNKLFRCDYNGCPRTCVGNNTAIIALQRIRVSTNIKSVSFKISFLHIILIITCNDRVRSRLKRFHLAVSIYRKTRSNNVMYAYIWSFYIKLIAKIVAMRLLQYRNIFTMLTVIVFEWFY